MADMLAWSLFWYLFHTSPLFIGGFIVKKDTHFGTFLYQNRCPDMKKVTYFDTRRLGDMELLKFCGIGRFCSATKDYSPQRLFFHEVIPCHCDSVACFSGFSIDLGDCLLFILFPLIVLQAILFRQQFVLWST